MLQNLSRAWSKFSLVHVPQVIYLHILGSDGFGLTPQACNYVGPSVYALRQCLTGKIDNNAQELTVYQNF